MSEKNIKISEAINEDEAIQALIHNNADGLDPEFLTVSSVSPLITVDLSRMPEWMRMVVFHNDLDDRTTFSFESPYLELSAKQAGLISLEQIDHWVKDVDYSTSFRVLMNKEDLHNDALTQARLSLMDAMNGLLGMGRLRVIRTDR